MRQIQDIIIRINSLPPVKRNLIWFAIGLPAYSVLMGLLTLCNSNLTCNGSQGQLATAEREYNDAVKSGNNDRIRAAVSRLMDAEKGANRDCR